MDLFKGYAPAIITPMNNSGTKINFEKFKELIEFQIKNGAKAIIFLGTTGEPATLNQKEKLEVLKFAVKEVGGRVPVIAGAGSNCTKIVVEMVKEYEKIGVDGILSVTPYYNKCTQEGLVRHYEKIAKATSLPIILYNVPGRTGVNMLPETVLKLSKIENIVGVKEASGNIEQIMQVIKLCDKDFAVYSGDDALTYSILALGGKGVISVLSNVVPKKTVELCNRYFAGDIKGCAQLQYEMLPLINALFSEVNPIPVKAAMNAMGFCSDNIRLPLTVMEEKRKEILLAEMRKNGVNV